MTRGPAAYGNQSARAIRPCCSTRSCRQEPPYSISAAAVARCSPGAWPSASTLLAAHLSARLVERAVQNAPAATFVLAAHYSAHVSSGEPRRGSGLLLAHPPAARDITPPAHRLARPEGCWSRSTAESFSGRGGGLGLECSPTRTSLAILANLACAWSEMLGWTSVSSRAGPPRRAARPLTFRGS